jgi:DNA-binding transcriptional MerR regulator
MTTPQRSTCHIGELAARSGLTPDALRYYERLGF